MSVVKFMSLPLALLTACQPPPEAHVPFIQLRPATLTLHEARYDTPPQFSSFELHNTGADVLYISVNKPQGELGDLVQLNLLPFTPMAPDQRRPVEVSLDPATWRWSSGTFETTLTLEVQYFFSGQDLDEPETPSATEPPEVVVSDFDLKVKFTIDCDLDDDGFDSFECAPICPDDVCTPADCDDVVDSTRPGADEICNARDDDCDGGIDENAIDQSSWYYDGDSDGYGDPATILPSCTRPGVNWVMTGDDCDDDTITTHPSGFDLCGDEVDNDCDLTIDEGCDDD